MPGWDLNVILNRSIEELFPDSVGTELQRQHIQTVGDLVQKTESELLHYSLSRNHLTEVKRTLLENNLSLGMRFNAEGTLIVATGRYKELDEIAPEYQAHNAHGGKETAVPRLAEGLLYFLLPKDKRECIPGDLQEEFTTIIVPKFGHRYATIWYCGQVARSIGPIVWPILRKLAGLSSLVGVARQLAHMLVNWLNSLM